ncbi:MAG: Clp protease N-terminal domain-containing protein [Propionibacteriaceae bacterium]
MFERFTRDARDAVVSAQAVAVRLGHDHIGTEHLVLALAQAPVDTPTLDALDAFGITAASCEQQLLRITGGNGLDGDAMRAVGIDLDEITRRTEAQFGPGALDPDEGADSRRRRRSRRTHLPFSTEAKQALEFALREALSLQAKEITSSHVLLGTLRAGGLGLRILEAQGASAERVRATITDQLRRSA